MSGFYVVGEERLEMTVDPAYWYEGPSTWRSPFRLEAVMVPVLRDASGRDGEWPEVIRLEHAKAYAAWHGDLLAWWPAAHGALEGDLLVPVFAEDLERLAWRRRKWWGLGPIVPWPWAGAPLEPRFRRRMYGGSHPVCMCATAWCHDSGAGGSCLPF